MNTAFVPLYTDFSLSAGTVANQVYGPAAFSNGNMTFRVTRNTAFTNGEAVTLSYTPNADVSKRLKGLSGDEVLPITNYLITNNVL